MTETEKRAARAREASRILGTLSAQEKNRALLAVADALENHTIQILRENEKDCAAAKAAGVSDAMLDRLTLTADRIAAFAQGVREVAALNDPVGEVMEEWERPNGLRIRKVRVPIGVIGMIYEARPNVTVDSAALALKSGNAVLLRGSGSALNSNRQIVAVMQEALAGTAVPPQSMELIDDTSHDSANEMMALTEYLDVLIPRGGAGLISSVVRNAKVPVIETGVGNCHVFVDTSADPAMAKNLIINSKTQRPAVCNAAETLLIAQDYPETQRLLTALTDAGVTIHGCERICALYPAAIPAREQDYAEEYLSMDLCVKMVADTADAIRHIARYGTGHTELIISENAENVQLFLNSVDAACVNHNASTRFTDGGQFGFGAEIGIATQKLHARGPLGLRELTIYKYLVYGNGQVRQ